MSNEPERLQTNPENNLEAIGESAKERSEQLRDNRLERAAERGPEDAERSAEKARIEALESAVSVEAGGAETKRGGEPSSPATKRVRITKQDRDNSYKKTMQHVQQEMSAPSRTFSKVIHNKTVEKTSEVVGATAARPNAILAGAVSAFVLTGILYITAKTIGYQLSGFESIGTFIIGWAIGMLFDYFRVMATGKR